LIWKLSMTLWMIHSGISTNKKWHIDLINARLLR